MEKILAKQIADEFSKSPLVNDDSIVTFNDTGKEYTFKEIKDIATKGE